MHGTCGLNNPWHRTCGRCQAGLEIRLCVTTRGSAGRRKTKKGDWPNENFGTGKPIENMERKKLVLTWVCARTHAGKSEMHESYSNFF